MKTNKFRFYAIKLSGIIILVFISQVVFSEFGFTDLFLLNENSFFQPWRFLTAIFLHGGIVHLFYNVFALVLFGSILEQLIGGNKFLRVFFISGILANLIAVNFYSNSLGASGAIFGVIGALVVIKPWMVVWAFGLPMPMLFAGALWAIGDVIGIFIPDEIGNIAHLSGMFFGLILGLLYNERRKISKDIVVDEKFIKKWEENYLDN